MQAVILAAGRGKRLRPLTDSRPKPLIRLNGKPMIGYILDTLPDSIDEIVIVIGYRGTQIQKYVGASWKDIPVRYVIQARPLGSYDALHKCHKRLRGRFLVVAADVLYHKTDLKKICSFPLSILVRKEKRASKNAGCCNVTRGYLKNLTEGVPAKANTLRNCAAYCLDRRIFEEKIVYGPNGESWLSSMVGSLSQRAPVRAMMARFHCTVSRPEDVPACERILASRFSVSHFSVDNTRRNA